jgi:endonuclease G
MINGRFRVIAVVFAAFTLIGCAAEESRHHRYSVGKAPIAPDRAAYETAAEAATRPTEAARAAPLANLRFRRPAGAAPPAFAAAAAATPAQPSFAGHPAFNGESLTLLDKGELVIGYSESRKDPLWVEYQCPWPNQLKDVKPRPKKFKTDNDTQAKVAHEDYSQQDYQTNPKAFDRGHMAPNYAIASRYGRDAQLRTFFHEQYLPQRKTLNQQTWEGLEKTIANFWSKEFEGVWVIVGPIFSSSPSRLNGVAEIPDAFYCIVIDEEDNGFVRVLALVLEQTVKGIHTPSEFVTTVDQIEAETGLDFLSDLPDNVEDAVESTLPDADWDLERQMIPTRFENN